MNIDPEAVQEAMKLIKTYETRKTERGFSWSNLGFENKNFGRLALRKAHKTLAASVVCQIATGEIDGDKVMSAAEAMVSHLNDGKTEVVTLDKMLSQVMPKDLRSFIPTQIWQTARERICAAQHKP